MSKLYFIAILVSSSLIFSSCTLRPLSNPLNSLPIVTPYPTVPDNEFDLLRDLENLAESDSSEMDNLEDRLNESE